MIAPALERRRVLQLLLAGSATLALPAAEPGAPLFFTRSEYELLDQLTELIIPADSHSGGAHEAGVARYIDSMVAESFLASDKDSWRHGLASIEKLSDKLYGQTFARATPAQQNALLKQICRDEDTDSEETAKPADKAKPDDAAKFFGQLKQTTAFAYYSSSLGIHQEIEYKGNVLLQNFVGIDVA